MAKNKNGLSRTIPEDIKFQIRKNSGYGCVICGVGIIEYEHVLPEFKDCKVHNPDKMTLLCPTCHSKKTRGFLSIESIQKAMLAPKAKELGYSKEVLDIGDKFPILYFAGSVMKMCSIPLMVKGIPIIQILPPETKDGPFLFSAVFFNKKGEVSLSIFNNEWFSSSSNWDLEVSAGRIIIKDSKNSYSLVLKTIDNQSIEIELIQSVFGDIHLYGNKNVIIITNLKTGGKRSLIGNFYFGGIGIQI